MSRVRAVLAGILVATFLMAAAPARAQVPPEAAPVLEVVAPIASPVCGNAILVVVLAPAIISGQLGGPLPVDIAPVTGPAFAICGSVPVPPTRLKCSADDQLASTLGTVTGTAAGLPLPIEVRPAGTIVDQLFVLQNELPAPASTAGLAETVAATLTCTQAASDDDSGEDDDPEATRSDDSDETIDELLEALPDIPALEDLPPIDSVVESGQLGSSAGPELAALGGGAPGFAYPVVFALPLLLLVLGAYLGRMLTRSVEAPAKP